MSKFRRGIVFGCVISGWCLQIVLGKEYYQSYIGEPFIQSIDVFGLLKKDLKISDSGDQGFTYDAFKKYEDIYKLLDTQFIDQSKIDFSQMQNNGLKGFVDAIGDPFTTYLDAKENKAFDEAIQGTQNFEGIGAVVTKKKDGIMIEEVLKGSPAFNAGLMSLDLVLKIDETSTTDLDLFDAVKKIRGPKGTTVILTIFRESSQKIENISVVRGTIDVPSVSGEIKEFNGRSIFYIELATFGEDTFEKFRDLIDETPKKYEGIILDMRGNGGGILPISVDIASFFVPVGDEITTVDYSMYPDEEFYSKGYRILENIPVVVLVDYMSASASEIVAAALRDEAGAKIVGTKTFGKGSVQTVLELDDGSSLKFSVGKWYTPKGENINEVGLTPDVEVELDVELFTGSNIDNQYEEALEVLNNLIDNKI